jgi:hypothetical protein
MASFADPRLRADVTRPSVCSRRCHGTRRAGIIRLLHQYSARPPLKFPTNAETPELARKILNTVDGPRSLWVKWGKDREAIVNRAAEIWIPPDDLREALNKLPGDRLTPTDVEQRIRLLRPAPISSCPKHCQRRPPQSQIAVPWQSPAAKLSAPRSCQIEMPVSLTERIVGMAIRGSSKAALTRQFIGTIRRSPGKRPSS